MQKKGIPLFRFWGYFCIFFFRNIFFVVEMVQGGFNLHSLKSVLFGKERVKLSAADYDRLDASFSFLEAFAKDRVIYGINTGFGPMAQWRVSEADQKALQYNIIRSHATGAGAPLEPLYVRAAMCARVGTFLQGHSGVHRELVERLVDFINLDIYPFIPRHGSVGASGDLVQLAHLALTLIGEGKVFYQGAWQPTQQVLDRLHLAPISILLREGLAATNGTSVMTGIAAVNQLYADRLLEIATLQSVWMNEIAASYDDWMCSPLQAARPHHGQEQVAAHMREIANGSKCLVKREHDLYNPSLPYETTFEKKVQAYYSLRCTPQILGPIYETYENARKVIDTELVSACDNPIIDVETQNVYHGGNFHGDYISLEADKVKLATVRLTMLAERQLNYLLHDRINGILPPFLNLGTLGLNYGMQACQFTATSTTAESQTLAMSNYVHSIPNNNDNQDIVSMGTNSALLCQQVLDNAYQVLAVHSIALAQATDCLHIADKLAPRTRAFYEQIRELCPLFVEDTPFYEELAQVEAALRKIV